MKVEAGLSSRHLKWLTALSITAIVVALPVFAVFGQESVTNEVSHIAVSVEQEVIAGESIAELTSFYQTIFGILIAALGLVVALAYLTIRAVSREAAVKTVQEEVNRYFTRDKPFLDSIQAQISTEMEDSIAESGLPEQLTQLDTRLTALEARTARLQQQDDVENGQGVVEGEGGG